MHIPCQMGCHGFALNDKYEKKQIKHETLYNRVLKHMKEFN